MKKPKLKPRNKRKNPAFGDPLSMKSFLESAMGGVVGMRLIKLSGGLPQAMAWLDLVEAGMQIPAIKHGNADPGNQSKAMKGIDTEVEIRTSPLDGLEPPFNKVQ